MVTRFFISLLVQVFRYSLFCCACAGLLFRDQLGFNFSEPESTGILSSHHLYFVVTTLLMLTGLVLFAFSKEKIEDEQISQLRLDSLQWSIYLSYILLILSLAFTTGQDFKDIMHLNVWLPLVFFIILFRWKMYRNNRLLTN